MTVDEEELIEVLQEYFAELLKAKKNVNRYVVGEFQRVYKAKDENLLDFESYADEFFKSSGYKKSLLQLSASEAPEQEKKLIARAFADINAGYFSGRVYDISQYEEGISLCREQGGFLSRYIDTLVEEAPIDNTSVIIE